jgi:serine/threonine protein kinase
LRRPAEIVLADFGVAHFANTADTDERPAGTPLYLAPEQFRGAPPTRATDLFAVGAILWEMAEGRPTRRHSDLLATRQAAPVSREHFSELGDIGLRLGALIDRLMSAVPEQRPETAGAALDTLV